MPISARPRDQQGTEEMNSWGPEKMSVGARTWELAGPCSSSIMTNVSQENLGSVEI